MSSEASRLTTRLADVEARLAALERAAEARRPPAVAGRSGSVSYGGTVRLHGEVQWTVELAADAVLALPSDAVVRVLAALGHPVRLALVRQLLQGPATVAELRTAIGTSSTGQTYHHLATLAAADVVEADGGARYRVGAPRVVPVLVALLAGADVGGALR